MIPVPPVTEQKRITEKLYLLEPLLASYENEHDLIVNQQHDFPEQLKNSILQEAVHGKLVPQDPADEPASIWLFAGNDHPRKSTKIARQVVNLPGDDLKRFVVFLHGIIHTHSRNIPVAGQGFF